MRLFSGGTLTFEHHPRRLAVLHYDLLDVFLELHAAAEFCKAPAELVDHRRGAAHGRAQRRAWSVETGNGVDHRGAHRAFSGIPVSDKTRRSQSNRRGDENEIQKDALTR